jgi:radical SAM superfamily enzyme YgiQ (UPF0313 family)
MNRLTLVLVSPPLFYEETQRRSFQAPLNLLALFAYLQEHHFDVTLLDGVPAEELDQRIIRLNPDLVGIPLYYASLPAAFSLVSRLRPQIPNARFIAGGPCLTIEPERMMLEGGFDFGVIGEGEETLAELLTALPAQQPLAAIPGLAWRQGGLATVNPLRVPIPDLDRLPYLDYSVVDNDYYFAAQENAGVPPTLFLNSSRGCSFRCTYCCTPLLWPGRVRRFSPVRLIEEIRHQHKCFPHAEIGFCDDSFFSDQNWMKEVLTLIQPLHIRFQCIGRADHLTPPLIGQLVEAGLSYIAFGVETGNPARQSRLRKNLDLKALTRNMTELAQHKIKTKCFFMLGFPDETLPEMAETINLASTLKRSGMTFFSIFPVTVYPGTELAQTFFKQPFTCGLDAHLPEIIRDHLGINSNNTALLDSPFNSYLTQRQMAALVTFAWEKVEQAETVEPGDLERIIRQHSANTPTPS